MTQYSPEFLELANRYCLRMNGTQITVPNELIEQGLDGFKQYACKLRAFYPKASIKLWEVTERLIEE